METVTVVDDPDALTPEWMTWVLQQSGLEVVVTDAVAERVGTGQIGASYRVRLTYAGDPGDAPASVVVSAIAPYQRCGRRMPTLEASER